MRKAKEFLIKYAKKSVNHGGHRVTEEHGRLNQSFPKGRRFRGAVVAACLLGTLLTGCSDPQKAKQEYLKSGERYYDKGQYREAGIQFQNAIQADSNFAEAHYKMAQTAVKLEQRPVALQEFRKAFEINPDHYGARLEMAKLLIEMGEYADAKEQLDVLKLKQPNNPDVFLVLAAYENTANKDTGAALADLRKALQMDPKRSDLYLSLGMLQVQGQQWAEAETNLKKAVDLDPKSMESLITLGDFYRNRGRYPEAEQVFRRAIQTVPGDPTPRLSLAYLFMAENKPGEAEDSLRQSKKDFPGNSIGYTMLGNFYIANHQVDKALAEYALLYQEHAKDPVVKKNYIQLLILKDRLDEARKLNDEVLKTQPQDVYAQIYKAEIEIHSGKASDAVDTLQVLLKNDPDNGTAHFQLGLAFNQLGNASRAEAEWREAVRLAPDFLDAHRALAGVANQQNDWSLLAQEADQIMALQPADPQGYWLRAMADIRRKQYASADEYIKRSIEKEANNPSAYLQLGDLRMAQNQFAEAQKAYQQALDQDPNSFEGLFGMARIDVAQKQPDKAMATIKAQLAKYPNNSGFHSMLGTLLGEEKKDLAGAEAEFRRAVELDKSNNVAWLKLGMVQSQRGAADTALQTYLDAAKNNPKAIDFYFLAGNIYEKKQDWDRAKQLYQRALTIEPDNPFVLNQLAYIMLQQGGNVDVAFAMAQTARRQLPDNPNSADTLGWAFYHKHVYTSAIGLFQEAVKKEPDSALYNSHLGQAYARNGQRKLAEQQLDKVMKIKPNSSEAEDLRRAIAEMKS